MYANSTTNHNQRTVGIQEKRGQKFIRPGESNNQVTHQIRAQSEQSHCRCTKNCSNIQRPGNGNNSVWCDWKLITQGQSHNELIYPISGLSAKSMPKSSSGLASPIMSSPYKFELNPISGLSGNAHKFFDQTEARKRIFNDLRCGFTKASKMLSMYIYIYIYMICKKCGYRVKPPLIQRN